MSSVQKIKLQLFEISAKNLPQCALTTSLLFLRNAKTPQGSIIIVRGYVRERNGLGGVEMI